MYLMFTRALDIDPLKVNPRRYLEIWLPAATTWIRVSPDKGWSLVTANEGRGAYAGSNTPHAMEDRSIQLWRGDRALKLDHWIFWIRRLLELSHSPLLNQELSGMALETAQKMEELSAI